MNKFLIGALATVVVAGVATPVLAYEGQNDLPSSARQHVDEGKSRIQKTMNDTRENVEQARNELKDARVQAAETVKSQKEQIETRRAELKQRLETARSERKAELSDKRLELCQQRQDKINQLIAASAKFGRERLTHIQNVEARVKEFYSRKNLASTEYDAALSVVDEKEALATAAVEVVESQTFECTKVDGSKPSGEIKSLHETKHQALNDYRDSLKQLIQIVKAAAQAVKADDGSAS